MAAFDRDMAVHVSDVAIMDLLLASMESFHNRRDSKPVETGGLLWGSISSDREMDHVTVAHISTDSHGKRHPDYFTLNETSTNAKCELMKLRWPHLTMIGDFHTHPYLRYDEVPADGPEFSDGDIKWYEEFQTRKTWAGRVGLVLTLAELTRRDGRGIAPSVSKRHGNTLHWQLGRYRFWLTAYAIDSEDNRLVVSPKSNGEKSRQYVYIDVPTINGTDSWFTWDQ